TKMITCMVAAALLSNAYLADAQQTGKVSRIGFLDASTVSGSAVLVEPFRQELSKLGWIEGKSIAFEYRSVTTIPPAIITVSAPLRLALTTNGPDISLIGISLDSKAATATVPPLK